MANVGGEYKTIEGTNALEMVETRSRFIGVATHVESVGEVTEFIEKLKRANKDAKHIAYAYSLGKDSSVAKNNDDGEPAGSAGAPIGEAISKLGLTDCLVAVVRYFGGIELGKSKLTRTYFNSALETLRQSKQVRMVDCAIYGITIKYPDFVPVGTYLRDNHLPIISAEYGDVVSLRVAFPVASVDKHISEIKMKINDEFMCSKIDSAYFRFD